MSEMVTVEISGTAARIIRDLAARTGRAPEHILSAIIDRGVEEIPVENLPDDQVLALCNLTMSDDEQTELHDLLDKQREGQLMDARKRLVIKGRRVTTRPYENQRCGRGGS